ncbi:MAG: heat-inducible transcriptional repressor HrcA [Pseudomonadota bacterium]
MEKLSSELNERAQLVFKCLVERYIADAQPVGSRTLAREPNLDLSPASIRNVMADLEDLGMIRSPHTSAGRIPTVRGYRFFVDALASYREPSTAEVRRMSDEVVQQSDVTSVLTQTSKMLSEITKLAGLVMIPMTKRRELRQVEFLPLRENKVLAILVTNNQEVENKVIQTRRMYSAAELTAI